MCIRDRYLSQDLLFDPFDLRLGTVRASYLSVNDTLSLSSEVFIPFDTLDMEYYLLLVVDSKNTIWESDEQNNEASLLIKINKTFSSDCAVLSVSSSSGQFYYGEGKLLSKFRHLFLLSWKRLLWWNPTSWPSR